MPSTSATTRARTAEPVGVVPDAVAPPPSHPRFAPIDGLRAVAALTVLAVHVALLTNAYGTPVVGRLLAHLNIGVSIFFLISGFLLYRPFIAHRAAAGPAPPATRDYARRRILRIYPAYWLALAVLVIVPGLSGVLGGQWLGMVALVHALPVYDTRACMDAPLGCGLAHTWSLVVELTFYAVLPLYVSGSERLTRGLTVGRWMRVQLVFLA
ncbi:MAG: acyltransferase family protein, partial [Thermoleophilaceae bacterium]